MKRKMRKILAAALALCLMLTGCTGGNETAAKSDQEPSESQLSKETQSTDSPKSQESEPSADKAQKITYNTNDSESWDPLRDSTVGAVVRHMLEGLTSWEKGELTLGAAETIDVSEDGLVYTAKISDEAVWSDLKPVTAQDFQYGILRILNPDNACKYAKDNYYLKNGEAYNRGEVSAEEVGVRCIDDKTIELTLEAPCAYFKELLAYKTYYPLRQDIVEGNEKWWSSPDTFVSNGPFIMESYVAGDKMLLKKNPTYRDASAVKLSELEIRFITDPQVELMAYKTGEIQVGIMPPPESLEELKASKDLMLSPKLTIYWLVVNTQMDVVNDARVRKALSMAIDRKQIVENVTKGEEIPAYGLCPNIVMDYAAGMPFRDVYPEYFEENVEEARRLLEEAGYPGGQGFPELVYAISTGGDHAKIAQAIQAMWKANLGIEVKIESLESAVFIKERKSGTYPIARYQWASSYSDPEAWLGLYLSTQENNDSKYVNPAYDELINAANKEADVAKRFDLLHQAEKMLIDDMAVIPLFYPTNKFIVKQNVKDVGFNANGSLYFKHAYIE